MSHNLRNTVLCAGLALFSMQALADDTRITVEPPAYQGILTNPGTGVASFHNGYGEQHGIEEHPDTGIEYVRFYWRELEPQEGKYNFAPLEEAFRNAAAHQPPMDVGLRFMALDEPTTGTQIPRWLVDKGIKGTWVEEGKTFVPDLDDPVFLAYVQRLLTAFGKRYDGNPRLAWLDIGMVGSWGEWHNSNFSHLPPLAERYTSEQLNRYVDLHFDAFPTTPKIMLIGGGDSLAYAARKGAGWRADCWGDWRNFSTSWSHMRDDYPWRLQAAQASWSGFDNAWRQAPVSLEICGYMAEWQSVQHYTRDEVQATFDWAIAMHASTINLKSRPVPREYRDIVDKALTKLGYRFRVVSLSHEKHRAAGQTLNLESQWSNDGVAPVYLPYSLVWRLVGSQGNEVARVTALQDIRSWTPGHHASRAALRLPAGLTPGHYRLEAALLNSEGVARIKLANKVPETGNWYQLSSITVGH